MLTALLLAASLTQPSLIRTAIPYATAYGLDYATSEVYMRQHNGGWEAHEANPFARNLTSRAALSFFVIGAATTFDYALQRTGHRRIALVYRIAFVAARILVAVRTLRMVSS